MPVCPPLPLPLPMAQPMAKNTSQSNRLAYYAAVSYQDYNIGKVLAKLEALGQTANTATLLLGDHG